MAYTQVTFATLKTQALNRMGNAAFWSSTEMGMYINEALRLWNVLTSEWKGREILHTTVGTRFYAPTTLINPSVTDQSVLNEAQYHLVETPNLGASWSELFTPTEVSAYLNDVYRRFVEETKLVLSNTPLVTKAEEGRYSLSSVSATLARLVRVAWLDVDNTSHYLQPVDTLQYDWLARTWTHTFGTPKAYTDVITPHPFIDIMPAPIDAGSLDLSYTDYGSTLSNSGVVLSKVPNDFIPFIKWGLLGVMKRKSGQGYNPELAAYCEMRFQEGIALADMLVQRGLWRVECNEKPLAQESMFGLDTCKTGWQATSGTPKKWFPYGMTQFGIYPKDSVSNNSLLVEGYKDAPVLVNDSDYLDLGQWEIEKLLDYVQHIALFKLGGSEFSESFALYRNFLNAASKYNSRVEGIFTNIMGADTGETLRPSKEAKKLQ